jgi:hypothetical protein
MCAARDWPSVTAAVSLPSERAFAGGILRRAYLAYLARRPVGRRTRDALQQLPAATIRDTLGHASLSTTDSSSVRRRRMGRASMPRASGKRRALRPIFTPPSDRALAAVTRSRADQLALELCQSAENGQHQSPVRRRRVGPSVTERSEGRSFRRDRGEGVEPVPCRSCRPIEPRHEQHVAGGKNLEQGEPH